MALTTGKPIEPDGPPAGGFQAVKSVDTIAFLADRLGEPNQSIPTGISTVVEHNQEQIDQGGYYNPLTYEYTPEAGLYFISAQVGILLLDSNNELDVRIMKNGVAIYLNNKFATTNNQNPILATGGITSADGTDVYTVEVEHNNSGPLDISSLPNITWFYAYKLGVL